MDCGKVEEGHEGLLMSPPPPHGEVSESATNRGVTDTSTTEASILSKQQIQQIIKKVNEDVDLSLMTENREEKNTRMLYFSAPHGAIFECYLWLCLYQGY